MQKSLMIWAGLILATFSALSQNKSELEVLTQTIRGSIIDADAKSPLVGATIIVVGTDPLIGAHTDELGEFKLAKVPVGRTTLMITYLGYESLTLRELMVTSGKELVLNLEMTESTKNMEEVVITATHDKTQAFNEMATVSARSFTVEETGRYAASYFDPARMAQTFAGVSVGGSTSDLFNEIVVRGNSPKGILWRLEGVEVPNPNHFGGLGSSGGAISMLSSSTLANSDFYTGAFPTEFGNALSGVFDLKMRNGNNQKREYAIMIGALGIEAAAEGYFSKNSKASYLINYRYSTLGILEAIGVDPVGDALPVYQDLSFKIHLPTRSAGTFSLWGLGGMNQASFDPIADSTQWEERDDRWGFIEKQRVGTIGLSHRILVSDKSYLKTVITASDDQYQSEDYFLDKDKNYQQIFDENTLYGFKTLRASTMYNHKFNARNTLRIGAIASHMGFNFEHKERVIETNQMKTFLDNEGSTQMIQAYGQWKHRLNDKLTVNAGMHYTQLLLNNASAFEPRVALKWQFSKSQSLSGSVGLHSRLEHLGLYLFEGTLPNGDVVVPNDHLELTKAAHAVIAYDHRFNENLRLKAEVYYQHLYDVPVEDKPGSTNSLINELDIWAVIGAGKASNEGTGRNYGIDITFEKFFSQQYYFLMTGSLYNSFYTPKDGNEYNTRFNGNFQMNLLGGKEFKVGKRKTNIIGLNGKIVLSGGNRFTPIDVESSKAQGEDIRFTDRRFESRAGTYYRFDFGISYKINRKKTTHSIMLDIQNITNHLNIYSQFYNEETNALDTYYQTGLFPVFNYRIEF